MNWDEKDDAQQGIFAVHGDLDGEKNTEFQDREQFIGVIIGAEEFLMPISAVREIIMVPPITFVPNALEHIDGVLNLRGTIIPAINMRKMMGIARGKQTAANRIIIVRHEGMTFGMIVDGITYVVALLPDEIENQTLPGKGTGAELIGSISKQGSKICGILDLQRVLKAACGGEIMVDGDDGAQGDAA